MKADISKIFKALPNVKTIWVTADGHFHLHPNNGGDKVERGDEVIEDNELLYGERPKSAEGLINKITEATSEEAVIYYLGSDKRKTVIDAAEEKIASFNV